MSNEIGQLDITDRQLLATGAPPRTSLSREIGEAQITHTICGRAKVRIIRKHDNIRRTLWWILPAVLFALVALQGWFAWQQAETPPGEDASLQSAPVMQESPYALRPDSAPVPAAAAVTEETFRPAPIEPVRPSAPPVASPPVIRPAPKPAVKVHDEQAAASFPAATDTLFPPVGTEIEPEPPQEAKPQVPLELQNR